MKKQIITMIAAVTFMTVSAVPVSAVREIPDERQLPRLVDSADLLSGEEKEALEDKLDSISEEYQCDVAVVTVETTDGASIRNYADDFYDYNGYGMGEGDDGILLLLDMGEREYWMTTYGLGCEVFTDRRRDRMEEAYVPYLSAEDYGEAFGIFAELCEEYLEEGVAAEVYEEESGETSRILWAFGALIIGMILSLIITGIMRYQMKTVRKQAAASVYIKPGSMNVSGRSDLFLYSKINKAAKPKDNDSGSSLHTSSSGRSHGGSGGSF